MVGTLRSGYPLVQLAIRFNGYQGRYVFHCHNFEHEDMGMMVNFHIG